MAELATTKKDNIITILIKNNSRYLVTIEYLLRLYSLII